MYEDYQFNSLMLNNVLKVVNALYEFVLKWTTCSNKCQKANDVLKNVIFYE